MLDSVIDWVIRKLEWEVTAGLTALGVLIAYLALRQGKKKVGAGGTDAQGGSAAINVANTAGSLTGQAIVQQGTGQSVVINIQEVPDAYGTEVERRTLAEKERDDLRQELEKVTGDKKSAEELLTKFETIPQLAGIPRSEQPAKVREIAENYAKLQQEISQQVLSVPEAAALRKKAEDALKKGDFAEAEDFLRKAAECEAAAARKAAGRADELFISAASAFGQVGTVKEMTLSFRDAAAYYQKAADTVPRSSPLIRATYLNDAGGMWLRVRRYPEGRAAWQEALDIRREHLPGGHKDLAESLHNLGTVLSDERSFAKAREAFEEALKIYRGLAQSEPHIYSPDVAMTLNNLGNVLREERNFPEARKAFDEALAIYRELARTEPRIYTRDVAMTLNNLGNVLSDERHFPEARKAFEEARDTCRDLARTEPHIYKPYVATTLNNLGNVLSDERDFPEARKAFEEASDISRDLARTEPHIYKRDVAMTLNNLGTVLREERDFPEARKAFEEALVIRRELARTEPRIYTRDVAMTLNNLGNLLSDERKFPEARKAFDEALAIYRDLGRTEPHIYNPDVGMTLNNLGVLLENSGDLGGAAATLSESVAIFTEHLGSEHHYTIAARRNLERVKRKMGET